MSYDYLFRIIILGHPGVGKSSLLASLKNETAPMIYQPTIGIDFGVIYTTLLNGPMIKTYIWDTAGQEYFNAIVRTYYRDIGGAIFVFDITNRNSFERIKYWLRELKEENNNPGKLVLVGNKTDLSPHMVTTEEGEAFAKKHDMLYYEISVKKKENITLFYYDFIKSIYDSIDVNSDTLPPGIKKNIISPTEIETNALTKDCCILL